MRRGRLDALPKRQRAWSGKMPFLVGPRIEMGIVEDDPSVREGMERMINVQSNWHLRFACGNLAVARTQDCQGLSMLLLDLGLPDGNGMDLLAELDVPVLIISSLGDEATVIAAIENGAAGYLLKDARSKDVVAAINSVLEGGAPISPGVASFLLRRTREQARAQLAQRTSESTRDNDALALLTTRESEVLRALTRGYSYEETGQLLGITRNTVGQHIKQIYSKLAVNSRSAAVFQAIQAGWLDEHGR